MQLYQGGKESSHDFVCTEITPRQDVCIICKTETNDGSKTVQLTEKETIGMNKASKERGDDIVAYINPIVIKGLKRKPFLNQLMNNLYFVLNKNLTLKKIVFFVELLSLKILLKERHLMFMLFVQWNFRKL